MWLLTVRSGVPGGREETRRRRASALWTVVVLSSDAYALATAPTAAITATRGNPRGARAPRPPQRPRRRRGSALGGGRLHLHPPLSRSHPLSSLSRRAFFPASLSLWLVGTLWQWGHPVSYWSRVLAVAFFNFFLVNVKYVWKKLAFLTWAIRRRRRRRVAGVSPATAHRTPASSSSCCGPPMVRGGLWAGLMVRITIGLW